MEVNESEIVAAENRGVQLLGGVAPKDYWTRVAQLRKLPYRKYLKTPEWQDKRRQKLESVGFKCQLCNSGGSLEVHHRTYKDIGCEALSDLTVLCRTCHGSYHQIAKKGKRKHRKNRRNRRARQ